MKYILHESGGALLHTDLPGTLWFTLAEGKRAWQITVNMTLAWPSLLSVESLYNFLFVLLFFGFG